MMPSSQMAPCLSQPLGRLMRHWSRVWIDSNATCHGAITPSPRGQFNGACNTTTYKFRIFSSLTQYEIFIYDIRKKRSKPNQPLFPNNGKQRLPPKGLLSNPCEKYRRQQRIPTTELLSFHHAHANMVDSYSSMHI